MSKFIPGNHKHLTTADRLYIERELNANSSFKEIRAHRLSDFYPGKGLFLNTKNFCIHRYHCKKKNVCNKIILCDIKCASCPYCNQHCRDFEKEHCSRLTSAMAVIRDMRIVLCLINIVTMRCLQTANTVRLYVDPDPVSLFPNTSSTRLIKLSLLLFFRGSLLIRSWWSIQNLDFLCVLSINI